MAGNELGLLHKKTYLEIEGLQAWGHCLAKVKPPVFFLVEGALPSDPAWNGPALAALAQAVGSGLGVGNRGSY
jgi:hypothetical protein